jgi:hypothetical protein
VEFSKILNEIPKEKVMARKAMMYLQVYLNQVFNIVKLNGCRMKEVKIGRPKGIMIVEIISFTMSQ